MKSVHLKNCSWVFACECARPLLTGEGASIAFVDRVRSFLRRAFFVAYPIRPLMADTSCYALYPCALQDSLLEITLRSRVIEKLSVALNVCLFSPQGEREQHPELFQDEVRGEASTSHLYLMA